MNCVRNHGGFGDYHRAAWINKLLKNLGRQRMM